MPALPRASTRDQAVSEVVGQILIFGILSMVLILSLLGFNAAKEGADERVEAVEAEAIAQRLAGVVVEMALFAERSDAEDVRLARELDLPIGIQGDDYNLALNADDVQVIRGTTALATANLFASGAPANVVLCTGTASGGHMQIVASHTPPTGCSAAGNPVFIFLENI